MAIPALRGRDETELRDGADVNDAPLGPDRGGLIWPPLSGPRQALQEEASVHEVHAIDEAEKTGHADQVAADRRPDEHVGVELVVADVGGAEAEDLRRIEYELNVIVAGVDIPEVIRAVV